MYTSINYVKSKGGAHGYWKVEAAQGCEVRPGARNDSGEDVWAGLPWGFACGLVRHHGAAAFGGGD